MSPDSTHPAESSAENQPSVEREDWLWHKLYAAAEKPAVAAVLVEHMSDQESAFSHRALFLMANATLAKQRRRQASFDAVLDFVTYVPRLIINTFFAAPRRPIEQPSDDDQMVDVLKHDPEQAARIAERLREALARQSFDGASATAPRKTA